MIIVNSCHNSVSNDFLNCLFQADKTVQVNSVQLSQTDQMATNGVIHFVDNILYPEGKDFVYPTSLTIPSINRAVKTCTYKLL